MKKVIAIFIAILFLLQSSQICFEDFQRIDALVQDAQLHQTKYGDDFFTFLSKHYGELKESHKEQHQQEEQEHGHKHPPLSGDCHTQVQPVVVWQVQIPFLEVIYHQIEVTQNFHYLDLHSTFEKPSFFQPPRFA